jgi:hypothetical protein
VAAPAIVPVATREPELPAAPFRATLSGTISNRNEASGLVVVTLDLHAGGAFRGRVHVALRGMPLDGGGVQMVQSAVGVLPRGATAWETASVVALQGQQIELAVRTPSGGTRSVVLDLQIDPASGRVSGVMRSGAALAATTADDGDGRGEGSE